MKPDKIVLAIVLLAMLLFCINSVQSENIDPDDDGSQFAYGENVGWLNFEPNKGPGVTVSDSNLAGFIWAENVGWINLWPDEYGGVFNDGNGLLSGEVRRLGPQDSASLCKPEAFPPLLPLHVVCIFRP